MALKKTDKPGVFKDTKTGALVNKNINALSAYKAQKKLLQDAKNTTDKTQALENRINIQQETISNLEKELKSLKSAVNALKKKVE
jgi:septal ring factor EnvC (AmiA/AmiB activator)